MITSVRQLRGRDLRGRTSLDRRVSSAPRRAYQAYYEHLPLRRLSLPDGPDTQMYRRFAFGSLASFFVLDTRQYRTDQPCGDNVKPVCAGVFDSNATMMGSAQERWLFDGIDRSRSTWNVIPQQVMMAPVDQAPGPEVNISMDQWAGYDVPRTRLLKFLGGQSSKNPVVLSGDIHNNWVNDLKVDFSDPQSPTVATELVGTSISSGGDGSDMPDAMHAVLAENPFVRFFNDQRGYVTCDVTPGATRADFRVVDYVTRAGLARQHARVISHRRPPAGRPTADVIAAAATTVALNPRRQARSNRSRFITLSHAATKSRTNFRCESSHA